MSRFDFQRAHSRGGYSQRSAARILYRRRVRRHSQSQLPIPNEGSGAPGNARACEALWAAGAATRHVCETCPLRLRSRRERLSALRWRRFLVPRGRASGGRQDVPSGPSVRSGCAAPSRPRVQPLKADPRSGAGRRPRASRVRGDEPRPQAPHPVPSSLRLRRRPSMDRTEEKYLNLGIKSRGVCDGFTRPRPEERTAGARREGRGRPMVRDASQARRSSP